MMYNNKMACAIKVGSEYSLFIKNLNTKKAVVNITIDGTDICEGGIVVYANDSVDIERFVKNHDSGNRFKFIERTAGVEAGRGVGVEDGLIRVEFQFERPQPVISWGPQYTGYHINPMEQDVWTSGPTTGVPVKKSSFNTSNMGGILRGSSYSTDAQVTTQSINRVETLSTNDAGITVEGSVSDQKFQTVSDFPLEAEKHVMILKLVGVHNDKPVEVVTPTRQKPKCVTCKRVNKATAKFCTECGTSLIII